MYPMLSAPICAAGEYRCEGTNMCIPQKDICNGDVDCPWRDDAQFCPECPDLCFGNIRCPNSLNCLSIQEVCSANPFGAVGCTNQITDLFNNECGIV
ncbi:low-density lipoprotein receptor-like [Mya arenaria]|uniref:low-density lipoprotein receptor-like n=1 Tax=Mya arenaria TaxID=6604 RepID=UPI0022E4EC5D|nr:low-density lipoprotein receptor-like [Mya arenaria]